MNEVILFSPVGSTDPISERNFCDGSMLHIYRRHREITKVILYLSREMLVFHRQDNRYVWFLERLAQDQGRELKIELIERPELTEVQEFEFFFREFRTQLQTVYEGMDESDRLILNISSGTPAMKSALLVLSVMGEFPCQTVQVLTPERRLNTPEHSGSCYLEKEISWDINRELEESGADRCRTVKCPTLSLLRDESILKKHIDAYDYQAALRLAKSLPFENRKSYIHLLEMAKNRLMLNLAGAKECVKQEKEPFFRELSERQSRCFEYALVLDIKVKRGEYTDFIRALTPLLLDLFEMILLSKGGVDVNDYCLYDQKKVRRWDMDKLAGTEIYQKLCEGYPNGFKPEIVYTTHLACLLRAYLDQASDVVDTVNKLRSAESATRNLAAHEIVSLSDEDIKAKCGFGCREIVNLLKRACEYVIPGITEEDWQSYKIMNEKIKQRIGVS